MTYICEAHLESDEFERDYLQQEARGIPKGHWAVLWGPSGAIPDFKKGNPALGQERDRLNQRDMRHYSQPPHPDVYYAILMRRLGLEKMHLRLWSSCIRQMSALLSKELRNRNGMGITWMVTFYRVLPLRRKGFSYWTASWQARCCTIVWKKTRQNASFREVGWQTLSHTVVWSNFSLWIVFRGTPSGGDRLGDPLHLLLRRSDARCHHCVKSERAAS